MLKAIQEINLADVLHENNPLENLIKQQRNLQADIEKKKKLLENFERNFVENDGDLPSFMIAQAKQAEIDIKSLDSEIKSIRLEISQLNVYNSNIDNAIDELKVNGTYEARSKINLILHEIIKHIVIDFELDDYGVMFKNGAKRFINNGIIQNVFRTENTKQRDDEINEILNHKN